MHRGAGVFGRDVEILFARFFARKKSETGLVNIKRSRDQVRLGGQDVAILANARDLSRSLELTQDFVQSHPHATLALEHFRQLDLVERPVIRRAQGCENALLKFLIRFHDDRARARLTARCMTETF